MAIAIATHGLRSLTFLSDVTEGLGFYSHFSTMDGGEGVSAPSAADAAAMAGGEGVSAPSAATDAAAAADQGGGEEAATVKAGTKRKAPDSTSPSPADEASAPAPTRHCGR